VRGAEQCLDVRLDAEHLVPEHVAEPTDEEEADAQHRHAVAVGDALGQGFTGGPATIDRHAEQSRDAQEGRVEHRVFEREERLRGAVDVRAPVEQDAGHEQRREEREQQVEAHAEQSLARVSRFTSGTPTPGFGPRRLAPV
jgi:hypothetical protein